MEELATQKGDLMPIHGIPPKKLEVLILQKEGLAHWLWKMLNIKETTDNKERLGIILPMITDNCWQMTINDIKKAFIEYIKGNLPIEPRDNYLTAILFAKVIKLYKQSIIVKTSNPDKEKKYKADQDILYAIQAFDFFIQERELPIESYWLYDYLEGKGLIKYTPKEKIAKYKVCLKTSGGNEENAKEMAKVRLVEDFFKRLEVKNEHINELI